MADLIKIQMACKMAGSSSQMPQITWKIGAARKPKKHPGKRPQTVWGEGWEDNVR